MILWGNVGEIFEYVAQSMARKKAEQRLAVACEQLQADAEALSRAQQMTAEALPRIAELGNTIVSAREQQIAADAAAKQAADEAAEAKRIVDLLALLPDPDDPQAVTHGQRVTNVTPDVTNVAPVSPGDNRKLDQSYDPDDPDTWDAETEDDDGELESPKRPIDTEHPHPEQRADVPTGDLPEELEKRTPEPIGNYFEPDIRKLAHPQTPPQQPVAVGLDRV